MIIHSNLSRMKNKVLPTCSQGNYRNSFGEISNNINTSCMVFRYCTEGNEQTLLMPQTTKKSFQLIKSFI